MTYTTTLCPSCNNKNNIKANFCSNCGFPLSPSKVDSLHKSSIAVSVHPQSEPERRQITLVKCKITSSHSTPGKLVPFSKGVLSLNAMPWLDDLLKTYQGKISSESKDSFNVCFGYPTAHDRIAQNALRFAHKLETSFSELGLGNFNPSFLIHSGEVVLKDLGQKLEIKGPAERELEEISAHIDEKNILVTAATKKILRDEFPLEMIKPVQTSNGLIPCYRVIHVDYFEKPSTFFQGDVVLGRENELAALEQYWKKVLNGHAKIVQVIGEPGIGKSHLIEAFKHKVKEHESNPLWLHGLSGVYTQNTAFFTIADVWFSYLPVSKYDPPQKILQVLEKSAQNIDLAIDDIMPLFSSLLTVLSYSASSLTQSSTEKYDTKSETDIITDAVINAIIKWMSATSKKAPLIFVMEDIQWADNSSLQIINQILRRIPESRIMILFSFRPDFVPSWMNSGKVISIHPNRLLRNDMQKLINELTPETPLSENVIDYIADKTDGIPFFIQELTHSILESHILTVKNSKYDFKDSLNNLTIPSTLRGSLDSRLDKLGQHKITAQYASVLGRVFSFDQLHRLTGNTKDALNESLDYLMNKSILYRRDTPSEIVYVFRHALIQEAAYASLLKSKKAALHAMIAENYEKHSPEIAAVQPEIIAEHYTAAGYIDQAASYWLVAGKRATSRSAFSEALTHFNNGLALYKNLPFGPGKDTRELPFKVALCLPLMVTKGWGAPEVERALIDAHEMCHRAGDTVHLITVLRGLQSFFVARGPLNTARDYAEQMIGLARQLNDPALSLEAHRSIGHTMFFQGEFESSKKYLREALRLFDPKLVYSSMYHLGLGYDPKIASLAILAWVELTLGYPERALKYLNEAIEYSDQIRHPFGIVYANGIASSVYRLLDDPEMTHKHAEKSLAIANEKKYVYWQGWAQILVNWSIVFKNQRQGKLILETDETNKAIAGIRDGIKIYRESGSELGTPLSLLLLAQCLGYTGHFEKAEEALTESLVIGQKNDINFLNSMVFRVKGELVALKGDLSEINFEQAVEYYRKSIEIAQQQKAKLFELRSTLRLYELFQEKRKESKIIPDLRKIFGEFTEGFSISKDLILAHKILDSELP